MPLHRLFTKSCRSNERMFPSLLWTQHGMVCLSNIQRLCNSNVKTHKTFLFPHLAWWRTNINSTYCHWDHLKISFGRLNSSRCACNFEKPCRWCLHPYTRLGINYQNTKHKGLRRRLKPITQNRRPNDEWPTCTSWKKNLSGGMGLKNFYHPYPGTEIIHWAVWQRGSRVLDCGSSVSLIFGVTSSKD